MFFLVADTWSVLGRPIVGHGADEWAGVVQLVNINDLSRIQLLAFFLNAYNLMVLHAHVVRGSQDGSDFKSQKIPFTRDNQVPTPRSRMHSSLGATEF